MPAACQPSIAHDRLRGRRGLFGNQLTAVLQIPAMRLILDHHTLPPEAATVFNRTRPKLAVYTHFVLPGTATVAPPTVEEIVAETRKTYSGPLQVGEDLMSFDISAAGVKVNAPAR